MREPRDPYSRIKHFEIRQRIECSSSNAGHAEVNFGAMVREYGIRPDSFLLLV